MFEGLSASLGAHDLNSLEGALELLGRRDAWWVAALDYELGYVLEPAAAPPGWRPAAGRPLARFWRFDSCRRLDRDAADAWLSEQLHELAPDDLRAGIGGVVKGCGEAGYRRSVERIREYIAAGDCYQVNFTFPLHFDWFGHPLALYAALRERQPVRYGGIVATAAGGVVSLSPELFLTRSADRLTTRPMKGTAPRHSDPEALRHSEKDRAENLMIVDLLRNDLGRIAHPGTVHVEELFEIEAYPSLWQMVSQISATAPGARIRDILYALFPCGSITGAPKIRAMQIAAALEGCPRGLYTGALGWVAPDGDLRLNVAIRTLELEEGGRGRLGVGSGIVIDSEPGAEWRECLLKSAFLTRLDPGLQLIETLRCEDGVYPRLELHIARLKASAEWFGFPCDEAALRRTLAAEPQPGVRRVRLTLDKRGSIEFSSAPLTAEPSGPRFAVLATERMASTDPRRRHKTSARGVYDAALAAVAGAPEVFDVVFLNERGEVAEGARSNVFVERGGRLLTPPVESGALPGVLRAELLAAGKAREAVIHPRDLAGGFLLGNALRGLQAVRLRPA